MNRELPVPVLDSIQDTSTAVTRMLQEGKIEEAAGLFDHALKRWPKSTKLRLLKGEILARTVGQSQAALHYAELLNAPNVAQWAAGHLFTLLGEKALPIDDAVVVAPRVCNAQIEAKLKERILDRLIERESAFERERLLEIAGRGAGIFRYEWKLAVARAEAGDLETAIGLLEAARGQGRHSVQSTFLLAESYGVCSRLPDAIALLEKLLLEHPDQPDVYRRLTNLLQWAGDFTRAGDVFESAFGRWPHDWMLVFRFNRLPVKPHRQAQIFDIVASASGDIANKNDRFRFHFGLACLHVGQVERGIQHLKGPFEEPTATTAGLVMKALGARSARDWIANSRLVDDRTQEVQIVRAKDARATIVVPATYQFGFLPLALMDSLFAEHGFNAIYLRDFGKRQFVRGISALGGTEEATLAGLAKLTAELGAKRTIFMGSSGCGFTALRYGALMGADAAVSFSGPTATATAYDNTKTSIWNPDFFKKILMQREGELPFDLVPVLSQPSRTKFLQIYGENAAADAKQAQRIGGLPGVTLMPVAGVSDHFVVDHMIGDGSFDALLEELVDA
jgi:tetratricopeptide (TPR) repeat protein